MNASLGIFARFPEVPKDKEKIIDLVIAKLREFDFDGEVEVVESVGSWELFVGVVALGVGIPARVLLEELTKKGIERISDWYKDDRSSVSKSEGESSLKSAVIVIDSENVKDAAKIVPNNFDLERFCKLHSAVNETVIVEKGCEVRIVFATDTDIISGENKDGKFELTYRRVLS